MYQGVIIYLHDLPIHVYVVQKEQLYTCRHEQRKKIQEKRRGERGREGGREKDRERGREERGGERGRVGRERDR